MEYIEYYKNRGTTVFVTFLDASKAFDKLNYWLLFDKLIKKYVPLFNKASVESIDYSLSSSTNCCASGIHINKMHARRCA